ncbi:hypothetical protein EV122DRAFT_276414 [Schizophyllum commune]
MPLVWMSAQSGMDKWLKYLTIIITALSGISAIFAVIAQYVVLVRESGNPMVWMSGARLLLVPLVGSGLNALIVQLFFASRIARFCRDKTGNALAGIISLTAIVAFGGSIADTMIWPEAKMQDYDTLHLCQKLSLSVARVWTVSSVICDVLIATAMIVLLARSRQEAHFRTTRQMLKRLIVQSIETGSITALVMILLLISYETMGTKNATYVVWQGNIAWSSTALVPVNTQRLSQRQQMQMWDFREVFVSSSRLTNPARDGLAVDRR